MSAPPIVHGAARRAASQRTIITSRWVGASKTMSFLMLPFLGLGPQPRGGRRHVRARRDARGRERAGRGACGRRDHRRRRGLRGDDGEHVQVHLRRRRLRRRPGLLLLGGRGPLFVARRLFAFRGGFSAGASSGGPPPRAPGGPPERASAIRRGRRSIETHLSAGTLPEDAPTGDCVVAVANYGEDYSDATTLGDYAAVTFEIYPPESSKKKSDDTTAILARARSREFFAFSTPLRGRASSDPRATRRHGEGTRAFDLATAPRRRRSRSSSPRSSSLRS